MAHNHPSTAPVLLGQLADQVDIHSLRGVADIEMDVDVDIIFAGELKDAADLAVGVGVVAWRAADDRGPASEAFNQQLFCTGVIGQPVLREDDVDRPLIIGDQRLHPLEPAHADRRVDLDLGAHTRSAVKDALDQSMLGPASHVIDRKARLQRRDLPHRADVASGFGRTAIDDAGLVEMDVRLDQPAAGEPPARIIDFSGLCQAGLDGDNLAASDTDIDGLRGRPVRQTGIAQDQIHTIRSEQC